MTAPFVFANADRASWRTQQRRRERDMAFLAKLRELVDALDEPRLGRLALALCCGPAWKRVAVRRCLARVLATKNPTHSKG
jgi:hypothetical protein